ncbi:MAG TPA: metallophosphoesterase [Vicinamibacterales bacterium]|jgi:hypothetical protein
MHSTSRISRAALVVAVAVALVAAVAVTVAAQAPAPARVVAIADVHGAFAELVTLLQRTALVDGNRHWVGGPATLVQTGDLLDRGPRSRECLDLVMDLERQAAKAGGRLVPLLGNHEAMMVMGDLRYVTPEIFRTFATAQSHKVREKAYRDYTRFLAAHAAHGHAVAPDADGTTRKKWMDEHPLGFFEYRDAFGPDGKYGRWIRGHHAIVQIGGGLFVHGGLNPALEFRSVAELDARVGVELQDFDRIWKALARKKVVWRHMTLVEAVKHVGDELKRKQAQARPADPAVVRDMEALLGYRQWLAASSNGPLWYRGLAQDPEEKLTAGLNAMLARLAARYVVVGHTITPNATITPRFASHVFAIDTGMLTQDSKGRASALEIRDGRFTAFYGDGAPQAVDPPALARPPLVNVPVMSWATGRAPAGAHRGPKSLGFSR